MIIHALLQFLDRSALMMICRGMLETYFYKTIMSILI